MPTRGSFLVLRFSSHKLDATIPKFELGDPHLEAYSSSDARCIKQFGHGREPLGLAPLDMGSERDLVRVKSTSSLSAS